MIISIKEVCVVVDEKLNLGIAIKNVKLNNSKKMKTTIIVLSAFFAFSPIGIAQTVTEKDGQEIIYVCPSHPDEMNPSSGKCPKCGMVLTKIIEKVDTHATKGSQSRNKTVIKYVCPMDGSTSDKPGECAKCAMKMVKTFEKIDTHATKGSQPRNEIVAKYVCPVDGTTSTTEGRCSKCGTGMVKITEKVDTHATKGSQPRSKTVTKYVCPMDGTTADVKGECPKCGMQMIEKENHKH